MRRSRSARRPVSGTAVALAVAVFAAACAEEAAPADSTLGMRVGGGLFDLEAFEAAEADLGVPIHYTVQFTGRQSQKDMNGSAFGLLAADGAGLPLVADRVDLSLTVPLGFGRANARTGEGRAEIAANLSAVAGGTHDDAYRRVARRLVEGGHGDAIIRLGHEFNGAWAPWSSRHNEGLYIEAFRHVHDVLLAEAPDLRFDWTAMRPSWDEFGPAAYPGDDYVDIVGLDIYWKVEDGGAAWSTDLWDRDFLPVLRHHLTFAQEHGKPVSYPEWGVTGADSPGFVEAMHAWLAELPEEGPGSLAYHAYFSSGADYDLANFPSTETAWLQLFGDQG